MTGWILAVLALFFVQTYLPNAARTAARKPRQRKYLRSNRDVDVPHTRMSGRMARALANMQEALPVFLALALLSVATGATGGWTTIGAAVFFFGRLAYIAAYGYGRVPLRSLTWAIGHAGLAMMVVGILSAAG